jgi:hypothetical protein
MSLVVACVRACVRVRLSGCRVISVDFGFDQKGKQLASTSRIPSEAAGPSLCVANNRAKSLFHSFLPDGGQTKPACTMA